MHSDREQVSGCSSSRSVSACGRMEEERVRRRVTGGERKLLGAMDIFLLSGLW